MNYFKHHPELRPGEVFLANVTDDQFNWIEWRTKRMGILIEECNSWFNSFK